MSVDFKKSPKAWQASLAQCGYIADPDLAFMAGMAVELERPLLLEGPAGSGKTFLASTLARWTGRDLVRLQCYEGLDAHSALYDWNYPAQLAAMQQNRDIDPFDARFLLPRALVQALWAPRGAVLLIDEIDRADEALEALLLEYLGEYQVTVPEWKTIQAEIRPVTVITSNRTRPLSDAIKRRCLYQYVDWPDSDRETAIIHARFPKMGGDWCRRLVAAVRCLRSWNLIKPPGLAETLDWAASGAAMAYPEWTPEWVRATLGFVVKDRLDWETVRGRIDELAGPEP